MSPEPAGWRAQLAMALEVPSWAWSFYRRHFLLVAGLSLIPAAQRAAWALWGSRLPSALNIVLEVLTLAARVLLVVLIARLAFAERTGDASRPAGGSTWGRAWSFLRDRWLSVVFQLVLLAGFAVVFDVVPERVIAPLIPADLQRSYWAALLALKNPTIIAFTLIWLVGAVRRAVGA